MIGRLRTYLCIVLISSPSLLCSQSLEDAVNMASEFFGTAHVSVVRETSAYCVVVNGNSEGYAIISIGRNVPAILGYSKSCGWHEGKMPVALMDWLDEIVAPKVRNPVLLSNHSLDEKREDILPLLSSHWHQSSPYNDLCPVIADGNVKTAAGCVAIAAAQVVYFWRHWLPAKTLQDTPIYPYGGAPVTYSIPAGTPNSWHLLRDDYIDVEDEEARAAVAQLVYVIGTTSFLNYAVSTGGRIEDAANALYGQFHMTSEGAAKADYKQKDWEQLLYDNLSDGCPIIYAGSGGGNGHAVVVDGYDSAYNLFHFNFGWGGSGDGYYTVDDVSGMNGYNQDQRCVHKLVPKGYKTNIPELKDKKKTDKKIYSIDGIPLGSTPSGVSSKLQLRRGVYILNGQKIVVR